MSYVCEAARPALRRRSLSLVHTFLTEQTAMQRSHWSAPLAAILVTLALVPAAALAQGRLDGEAIPGRPFGIARVTIPVDQALAADAIESGGFLLVEDDGRALYPVFATGVVRRAIGEVLGVVDLRGPGPEPQTVHFLFTGSEPLKLTIYTPQPVRLVLTPAVQPARAQTRLSRTWWRQYVASARRQVESGDHPPLMETYLTGMLASRLGTDPPRLDARDRDEESQLRQTLELLAGTEKLRAATMRDTLAGRRVLEPADRPLPPDAQWLEPVAPRLEGEVAVEPLAMRVPVECFYARFGKFSNYLWLDALMKQYGGDLSRMIQLRAHNAGLSERMQRQLALKQSVLAELLGDTVIADVALIGRDCYTSEGAAVGMIFQARNNAALSTDLNKQRADALDREKAIGAKLETVRIADRDVSFLSTPDNQLRSYYAVDGNFHLVTTSRAIVERFFETGEGHGSLGDWPDFRLARSVMPLDRGDTVFVYFSAPFFQGLVSPQYQVELARRLEAVTDIELLQLARLAAKGEGQPHESIDDLVRGGFLPANFGRRNDGSGPITRDGVVGDSLRGARGTFVPVPDVKIEGITQSEAARCAARSAWYVENWRNLDPLMIGIRREPLREARRERLVIDANVTPFAEGKYGWLASMLGPPTTARITPAPGDIVTMQGVFRGNGRDAEIPLHHIFLGIQDTAPLGDVRPTNFLRVLEIMRTTPGYLGGWPAPGILDWLPLVFTNGPDELGYSRLPLGVWRRQWDAFSVLSFDRDLLDRVTPHLTVEEVDSPAQVRVHVGDLPQSKLTHYVNMLYYQRARQASLGNLQLVHAASQQFGVPRDEALAAVEKLLDVRLDCTLGGDYELVQADEESMPLWTSTRLRPAADPTAWQPPGDYTAPILEWFHGLDGELIKFDNRVLVHTEIDMEHKPKQGGLSIPTFDFFGNGKKPTGGQADDSPFGDTEKPKLEVVPPPRTKDRDGVRDF